MFSNIPKKKSPIFGDRLFSIEVNNEIMLSIRVTKALTLHSFFTGTSKNEIHFSYVSTACKQQPSLTKEDLSRDLQHLEKIF